MEVYPPTILKNHEPHLMLKNQYIQTKIILCTKNTQTKMLHSSLLLKQRSIHYIIILMLFQVIIHQRRL